MRPSEYENELKQRDDTIQQQADTIGRLTARIGQLETESEELKKLLAGKAEAKSAKKPTFTQNYSLDKNERKRKRRKKSTGRRSNDAKRDLIEHRFDIFPPNADRQQCVFRREQFAWRLINGRAVYVAYNIHDLPDSKELPLPTGLRNSRSEYGIEIILTLAYLHYWIGVSIDNAREIMRFFTGLELPKSGQTVRHHRRADRAFDDRLHRRDRLEGGQAFLLHLGVLHGHACAVSLRRWTRKSRGRKSTRPVLRGRRRDGRLRGLQKPLQQAPTLLGALDSQVDQAGADASGKQDIRYVSR